MGPRSFPSLVKLFVLVGLSEGESVLVFFVVACLRSSLLKLYRFCMPNRLPCFSVFSMLFQRGALLPRPRSKKTWSFSMFLFVSGGADIHEGDLEMENTVQRVRVFVCVCVRVF